MNVRVTAALAALAFVIAGAPAPSAERVTVLASSTPWRGFVVWKTEQVKRASGEVQALRFGYNYRMDKAVLRSSAPPPEGWTATGFDDGSWGRLRLPLQEDRKRIVSLVCLRGRFRVEDPALAGGLELSAEFGGGLVAYVNGREVARAHMPAGQITPDTPADDYPRDAYVDPDGHLLRLGFGDPKRYPAQFAKRVRRLSTVKIPTSALRKGVNVLALEVHRPLTDDILYTGKPRVHSKSYCRWSTIALKDVKLTAPDGSGVEPNSARPAGLQVWVHDPAQRVLVGDFGDPCAPPRPLSIPCARNGSFAGQLVVGSRTEIKALKVTVSDLKGPGDASLPASAVQVRYALPDGPRRGRGAKACFGTLDESPPQAVLARPDGDGAVLPLLVTVDVPADSKPGAYKGEVKVTADGAAPVSVPVEISIHGWNLPNPKDFVTHVGLVQSPESVALKYGVELWSEKHWKLVKRAFELIGRAGADYVAIPVVCRTHFGNEHTMVRWIRKPGGWDHDFSIVERYLDTALDHLGKPEVVCIYAWDMYLGAIYFNRQDKTKPEGKPLFTVIDPRTGKLTQEEGPPWGTPEAPAFWKPVFDGLRKILAKRGIEKSMMLGIAGDTRPSKTVIEGMKSVVPDLRWVLNSHARGNDIHGQAVGYYCDVWSSPQAPDPSKKRLHGWKPGKILRTTFPRAGSNTVGAMRTWAPLGMYRMSLEGALTAGIRGFGRMGADFWGVIKDKRGRAFPIMGRYPETGWAQLKLSNSTPYVLSPGPEGPVATMRFEMIRLGAQEAEARVFIEKALNDEKTRAALGDGLAARCQALLDERTRTIIRAKSYWPYLPSADLAAQADALYGAAAEVVAKLGADR